MHVRDKYEIFFLCFVDCASRYNLVKKNQLDAQLMLSTFRHPLYVSGLSRPIIRRYNRTYTRVGIYYSFLDDCIFGGLEVACWPLVPKFAGSNPAEAV
jgi:hypothetical protein